MHDKNKHEKAHAVVQSPFMYMYFDHYTSIHNYTRIIKNIFNKNERRCRDFKTQKACEQGWDANIGPKIKQTTSI